MTAKTIRIMLVDDHGMVRNGIRLMLANDPDLEIAGEAETAQQAVALAQAQPFDVALVDISLPDRSGLDLLRQLVETHPKLAVLIISMYSEEVYAVRALKHGAAGYLTKDSSAATMVAAIRKAAAGGKVVSAATAQKLAGMIGGSGVAAHEHLSDRELEVMKLIAAGESLVDIAERLHLSPSTVTTYRTRILEKMKMKNNAELTRYVYGNDLM
jgi:DNA-binding NarL/FixJ family response regulator